MRELSPAVEAIKNSQRFTYYDRVEIYLPLGPGDAVPRVLKLSTAEIEVSLSLSFDGFTYAAFSGALARAPFVAEMADWVAAFEEALAISSAALLAEAQSRIDDLFGSDEYTDRMRSDEQFVDDLYRAFLGRVGDTIGRANHLADLAAAVPRSVVRQHFYYSTEFIERVASMNLPTLHDSDVRDIGDLTFSDGAATDGVEFALTNAENTYSDIIGQSGRRLYPAPAVVSRAFKLEDGTFEKVEMLFGFARFSVTDGDNAKVSIFSDMDRRGVDVIEMVSQHCIHIYKGPGCDSSDASPTCSRILNDATNGCISKEPAPQIADVAPPDNRPSFKGLPQEIIGVISTAPPGVGIPEGEAGSGGWPINDYDPYDPIYRKPWLVQPVN